MISWDAGDAGVPKLHRECYEALLKSTVMVCLTLTRGIRDVSAPTVRVSDNDRFRIECGLTEPGVSGQHDIRIQNAREKTSITASS